MKKNRTRNLRFHKPVTYFWTKMIISVQRLLLAYIDTTTTHSTTSVSVDRRTNDIIVMAIGYSSALCKRRRNFEPLSSDEDDTRGSTTCLLNTRPHQLEDVRALDRFSVHRSPTQRVFSDSRFELITRKTRVCYLDL
ncbi:hypothetical protein TNCV_1859421 [Trichonephila clavipes]|nr:hypothetical protein TNCV_1859421 [Trichonephila clavipes]